MQNLHRHTSYSNVCIADSAATNEQYAKRAVELGHKVISSVEHGWQGYYYQCYELAQKYNLKFVFGAEAYWVKDRQKEYEEIDPLTGEPLKNKDGTIKAHKDNSNCHILLLAKTEIGRRAINKILSEANETGYYFRPRVDLELLLSLPPDDVVVTTACVAYWKYNDIEDITLQLWKHFGKNFYLEIQAHDTDQQREISRRILSLSQKYGIEMIVGLDSHYIYPEQAQEREYILEAKDVHYKDEEGWYMDYPDDEEVMRRFMKQGVFTREQVQRAMDNTDISLTFDDYAKDNPVFSKNIKLPTLYPNLSQEERNKKYSVLISKLFREYAEKHHITGEEYKRYFEGIKMEVQTVKDTGMADYFLLDYEIVKKAIEKGGVLTDSGRGSSVGYFTNTLLGFSKVDRFQSPITLYPERFISKTRILETHSLPDIDLNWGTPEIAEEAQKEILGDNHAIPMIAFGTCKKKSAFKLFARSQNMDFELANTISSQIADYEEAVKNAEDDDKDQIDIYDFVDKKYFNYIEQSKKYWGIIMDKKKAPCSFLLYQGNIREEIGLIKCKSESTGKEFLTAVVDGAIAENYKFLKNDILCVSIVLLVDKIYRRIGIPHKTVEELKEFVKNDPKTWDIYKNGYTLGVNQCEQVSSAKKMMRFQAKNISELSAWIAAIRPAFKSMYSKFESRESFSYGIPAFDKLLQTEELPQSWILYQEQSMSVLSYAGFPMDECYGIIKAIAKKHPEKVRPLKDRFIEGFKKRIVTEEGIEETQAQEMSERVWQIINDSCGYGFNSAHAYCMAIDSLSCAMLKANYPYEFYEVLLQFHSDRGEKDKVGALKAEMKKAFGIQEGPYRFGEDNRKFNAIPERGIIQPSLLSIKGLSQDLANDLYELSQTKRFDNFIDLLREFAHMKSMNVAKLDTLIKIGYFSQFGSIGKLLNIVEFYNKFGTRKTLKESDVLSLPTPIQEVIAKYTVKPKTQYKITDNDGMLRELTELVGERPITMMMRLEWEREFLGYCASTDQSQQGSWLVLDIDTKYSPKLSIYAIWSGEQRIVKVSKRDFQSNPLTKGDTIRLTIEQRPKTKLVDGQWVKDESVKEDWLKYYSIVK